MFTVSSIIIRYCGGFVIFLFTFAVAHWIFDVLQRRKRYPPGPTPLPVIGNLLSVGRRVDKTLPELGKRYGDIFTIYFGTIPMVILNSYATIREAFTKQGGNFTGRPNFVMFEVTSNKQGIVMSDGEVWMLHRKVLQNILRDFGFGKATMEDKIQEECSKLIKELVKTDGKPVHMHYFLAKAISNVTCSVIYGQRFEYDDPTFHTLIERYDTGLQLMAKGAIVNFIPALRHIPGDLFWLSYIHHTDVLSTKFNKDRVMERLKRFDPQNIETFIDAYINAMYENGKSPDKSEELQTQMAKVFNDFFGAGTETTSTTLRWSILYLLHHPEYQKRVQAEINDVIGRDKLPSMTHMRQMPFTEAFLCEALRLGNITPLGLFHRTIKDVLINGHPIPSDTVILPNMSAVLMNPDVFPDPETFYPERFINADGKVSKPESFIPFSIGKRVCLGESLARMELFIFFTMLLQKFSFRQPQGHVLPGFDGILALTRSPSPFKVCVLER